jgi:hypothetical protein
MDNLVGQLEIQAFRPQTHKWIPDHSDRAKQVEVLHLGPVPQELDRPAKEVHPAQLRRLLVLRKSVRPYRSAISGGARSSRVPRLSAG